MNKRKALLEAINRYIFTNPYRIAVLQRLRNQFALDALEGNEPQTEGERNLDRLFVVSLRDDELPIDDDLELLTKYTKWIEDNFPEAASELEAEYELLDKIDATLAKATQEAEDG